MAAEPLTSLRRLFVGGLAEEATAEDLSERFSAFGVVSDVSMARSKEGGTGMFFPSAFAAGKPDATIKPPAMINLQNTLVFRRELDHGGWSLVVTVVRSRVCRGCPL